MVLGHPARSALATPPITSSRISAQTDQPATGPPRGERGGRGTTTSRTTTRASNELSPPKSACSGDSVLRTSTRGTVHMGQCAPEDSISQCPFLQMRPWAQRFPRGYAGSSQSDCPAAAGVGWRDGDLEAHRLLRTLRAPWRSGPRQRAGRVKGVGKLPPQCMLASLAAICVVAGPASHAHPVASKRLRNQTPHA